MARAAGVRYVQRPLPDGGTFSLGYVRTSPGDRPAEAGLPVFVLPGGPGLASVLPYQRLRATAAKAGLDVLMMEHRGIGFSRRSVVGADLPRESITIRDTVDDIAAVLDAQGIDKVVVYGCSYGSCLAQGLGVLHPERVAGMILDSAMLGSRTNAASARLLNSLFWEGTETTRRQADRVRALVGSGAFDADGAGFALQFLYEFGGLELVDRVLSLLEAGKGERVLRELSRLGDREVMKVLPLRAEFDLVGEIAFRELDYAGTQVEELPLSTVGTFATIAQRHTPYQGDPFDLPRELPRFGWPTVVLSGERDLRTPRVIAEEIVDLVPDATLVPIREHGHSALDMSQPIAVGCMGTVARGIDSAGGLDRSVLPASVVARPSLLGRLASARIRLAEILPARLS